MVESLNAVIADVAMARTGRPEDVTSAAELDLEQLGLDRHGIAVLPMDVDTLVERHLSQLLLYLVLN
jgi:hypothetical protein